MDFDGKMDELFSVLQQLVMDPIYNTKHLLDVSTTEDIAMIIIKYVFSEFRNNIQQ